MYFKKNLWQRIKFAFKTLLSDAPLRNVHNRIQSRSGRSD